MKIKRLHESLSPKKGDRVQMDYYAKLNDGEKGTVIGRIGELCSVKWDDGTISKEIKGFLKVINDDINEAHNFGGAFDIDSSDFFTKDEVLDFGEEVVATLNDNNIGNFELEEIYITDMLLEISVTEDEFGTFSTAQKIDLRKIKRPADIFKYKKVVVDKLISQIKETTQFFTDTNESLSEKLNEDIPVEAMDAPKEGAEFGIAELINGAIKGEYDAISDYNTLAVSARAEGYEDIAKVAEEIGTEEHKHVGQLQEVLKLVSPNAAAINVGVEEGKEQVNEIETIESSNTISEGVDDKMDTWQKVLQHFKNIEKLVKDGEAVTALVDEEYRLNKGNEAYEIAYQKWNDGAKD